MEEPDFTDTFTCPPQKLQSCGDIAQLAAPPPPQRRARSLDRRTSDTAMTVRLCIDHTGHTTHLNKRLQSQEYILFITGVLHLLYLFTARFTQL